MGPLHIDVAAGEHEEVSIQLQRTPREGQQQGPPLKLEQFFEVEARPSHLTLRRLLPSLESGRGPPYADGGVAVLARVPPRFCSLELRSGGGPISVATLTEAALSCASAGGRVELGRIRGHAIDLDSGGGDVRAVTVEAERVRVDTGGGCAHLQRAVGRALSLRTAGGAAALGALYGGVLNLDSAGGSLEVGTARLAAGSEVQTGGGKLRVGTLDGACKLDTEGGDAEVQLGEGATDVAVRAAGGRVRIFVPPPRGEGAAAGVVRLAGGCGVSIDPALELDGAEGAPGGGPQPVKLEGRLRAAPGAAPAAHAPLPRASQGDEDGGEAEDSAAPSLHLTVVAGEGAVELNQRSWLGAKFSQLHSADGARGRT